MKNWLTKLNIFKRLDKVEDATMGIDYQIRREIHDVMINLVTRIQELEATRIHSNALARGLDILDVRLMRLEGKEPQ